MTTESKREKRRRGKGGERREKTGRTRDLFGEGECARLYSLRLLVLAHSDISHGEVAQDVDVGRRVLACVWKTASVG